MGESAPAIPLDPLIGCDFDKRKRPLTARQGCVTGGAAENRKFWRSATNIVAREPLPLSVHNLINLRR